MQLHPLAPATTGLTLGSAADNDVVLALPGVSKRHARLLRDDRGFVLMDLGSKNGLLLDGARTGSVVLAHGSVVQLGEALLTLEEISTSEAEIDLPLAGANGDTPVRTSATDDSGPSAGAAAALRLIRQIEGIAHGSLSQPPRRDLLDAARAVLGARALALAGLDPAGDLVLRDCWGGLDAGSAGRLEHALRSDQPEGGSGRASHNGGVLLARGRGGDGWFAAILPETGRRPPAWVRDFFGYLAERVTHGTLAEERSGDRRALPGRPEVQFPSGMVVGSSPAMRALVDQLEAAVQSDFDILLVGETGTGKELVARAIHASGPGPRSPFVAVNCAAIPGDLLEAELFGVAARVATGVDPRPGLFVQAEGGTLLLDEIGELPERLQAKLLRVLQEREVLPLGGSTSRRVDTRVVSASNRNIAQLAAQGVFRADLYYRLRGLEIHIPPLRERLEDLPELVVAFATAAARKYRKRVLGVSRRALAMLMVHDWPGNVRELETEVARAVLLCPSGGLLDSKAFGQLQASIAHRRAASPTPIASVPAAVVRANSGTRPLQDRLDEVERRAIGEALTAAHGNKSRAARLLGVTRNGLALKLKRLGLE